MSLRTKRHIRRRADLPPVPYHRWVRPLATFLILLGIAIVIPAMYYRGATGSILLGGALFALIATIVSEYLPARKPSRKARRRKPVI